MNNTEELCHQVTKVMDVVVLRTWCAVLSAVGYENQESPDGHTPKGGYHEMTYRQTERQTGRI